MKLMMLLSLGVLVISGCTHSVAQNAYIGHSVAEVLKEEKITLAECRLTDDPPGVLSTITFGSKQSGQVISIRLTRAPELFSDSRNWSSSVIERAKVSAIVVREK